MSKLCLIRENIFFKRPIFISREVFIIIKNNKPNAPSVNCTLDGGLLARNRTRRHEIEKQCVAKFTTSIEDLTTAGILGDDFAGSFGMIATWYLFKN